MKKHISMLLLVVIVLNLIGCGKPKVSLEARATKALVEILEEYKNGVYDIDAYVSIANILEEKGLSKESKEDFFKVINAILSILSYEINSCAKDEENDSQFIINVTIKTIDGAKVFLDEDAFLIREEELTKLAIEGEISSGKIFEKGLTTYIKEVQKEKQAFQAIKNVNCEFIVSYDIDADTFTVVDKNDLSFLLLGLDNTFETTFKTKMYEGERKGFAIILCREYFEEYCTNKFKDHNNFLGTGLIGSFGFIPEGTEVYLATIGNFLEKLEYEIAECNGENDIYYIKLNILTVDGNSILLSDEAISASVDGLIEVCANAEDKEDLLRLGVEGLISYWKYLYKASETVEATNKDSITLKVQYSMQKYIDIGFTTPEDTTLRTLIGVSFSYIDSYIEKYDKELEKR